MRRLCVCIHSCSSQDGRFPGFTSNSIAWGPNFAGCSNIGNLAWRKWLGFQTSFPLLTKKLDTSSVPYSLSRGTWSRIKTYNLERLKGLLSLGGTRKIALMYNENLLKEQQISHVQVGRLIKILS